MKLDDIVELLRGVPLFSGLSDKQLAWIALSGEPVIFMDGREIISDDEAGDSAFLLLAGEAKRTAGLYAGEDAPDIGPGTFIGEMAMLVESDYSSTVTAAGQVRALKFQRDILRSMMEQDPQLAEHFRDKITNRFLSFVGALKAFRDNLDVGAEDVVAAAREGDGAAQPQPGHA